MNFGCNPLNRLLILLEGNSSARQPVGRLGSVCVSVSVCAQLEFVFKLGLSGIVLLASGKLPPLVLIAGEHFAYLARRKFCCSPADVSARSGRCVQPRWRKLPTAAAAACGQNCTGETGIEREISCKSSKHHITDMSDMVENQLVK